jgi:hypothetical protein
LKASWEKSGRKPKDRLLNIHRIFSAIQRNETLAATMQVRFGLSFACRLNRAQDPSLSCWRSIFQAEMNYLNTAEFE